MTNTKTKMLVPLPVEEQQQQHQPQHQYQPQHHHVTDTTSTANPTTTSNRKRNRKKKFPRGNRDGDPGGWIMNVRRRYCHTRSIFYLAIICYLIISMVIMYRILFETRVGYDLRHHSMEYFTMNNISDSSSSWWSSSSSSAMMMPQLFHDVYSRTAISLHHLVHSSSILHNNTRITLVRYYEHHDICHGCLYETYDSQYKVKTCFMAIHAYMTSKSSSSSSKSSSKSSNASSSSSHLFLEALQNVSATYPIYCHRCHPIHCQQAGRHERKFYRIDDIMTNTYMIKDARTYRLLDPPSNIDDPTNHNHHVTGHGIHIDHRIPWTILNAPNQLTQYLSNPNNLYPDRKYFYEYNPSIILLPLHQRPTSDAIYLMSFRVSTRHRCLLDDGDVKRLQTSYLGAGTKTYHEDHLGVAILDQQLRIISQTVVNFMKIAQFKHNFQDPKLYVLHDQIYLASYHMLYPLWLIKPSSHHDNKIYQVDDDHDSTFEESTMLLPYYYPEGLLSDDTSNSANRSLLNVYVRKAKSCTTYGIEQYGGKNMNYFVDGHNRIMLEIFPMSSKEVFNVSRSCQMKSRYDLSNHFVKESFNQTNGIYPVRSYGTSDELQYIQQNVNTKPYTNEWGSICCVKVRDPRNHKYKKPSSQDDNNNAQKNETIPDRHLLLGISHSKIASTNKKVPKNMLYNYYSTFYVMEEKEPYHVVARSGRFCLGYPNSYNYTKGKVQSSSQLLPLEFLYPRLRYDPLIVGNHTYNKCPKVHTISGMTIRYDNPDHIILSYSVDDCLPRIVIVEISKILQLLFDPHDDLLLLTKMPGMDYD